MPRRLDNACDSIASARTVAIAGHTHPDGDSIGSMLALALGLRRLGKKVYCLCDGEVPPQYRRLPGAGTIVRSIDRKTDLAIAVDCSAAHLLGRSQAVFRKAGAILVIDHHQYVRPFGSVELIDPAAAAVGELVYLVLRGLGVRMDRDIGENILTSIIVETNLFRISHPRLLTFAICAEALEAGVDFTRLAGTVYGPRTRAAALLLGHCLLQARTLGKGRVIWSLLRRTDMARLGGRDHDADAIAGELRAIKGVRVAVLFREKDRQTLRVGLRSTGSVDVGKLAQRFGGGGHADIAGCYIPNDVRSMRKIVAAARRLVG